MNPSLRLSGCLVLRRRDTDFVGPSSRNRFSRNPLAARYPDASEYGYTLHETLIALVIAGIVSIAAVSFVRLLGKDQMTTQVNTLIAHMSLARSEAIKRGEVVTICKSSTGTGCTETSQWHEGWMLFTDTNENGELDIDETILRIGRALDAGTTLTFGAWGPGRGEYVNYRPNAMTKQNGTFTFCNTRGVTAARAIILYRTGRARISSKNAEGGPLSCP